MPPPPNGRQYALGRECVIEIDGQEAKGVSDVLVREYTTEIDATGFNHKTVSTLVVMRTLEIEVTVPDIEEARRLYELRDGDSEEFRMPTVVDITLRDGLIEIDNKPFVIADVNADEPLDGVVAPRFTFRQWEH